MSKHLADKSLIEKLFSDVVDKSINHDLYVVGISGLDASGKSTIAKQIYEKLIKAGQNSIFISGDSFQYSQKYKNELVEPSWALQHIKRTINFKSMVDDFLKPIQNHPKSINLKIIDYDSGEKTDKEFKLKYPLIVVIESIYLFQPNLLKYIDYKVYLEISISTALERAKERPRDLFLYKDEKGIVEKYTNKNFAGHYLFLEKYNPQKYADIVIDNNDWHNPVLITGK